MRQRLRTQAPKSELKLNGSVPSWDRLYEVAESQQGCFSTAQAREVGFSDQLLQVHLHGGKIERLHRGIYRLTRFPSGGREQEDLMVVWLWSHSAGVFSHETALRLFGLTDVLPARIHLTLPAASAGRSMTPPVGVRLYFADFTPEDCTFVGAVPVTKPGRTINDMAAVHGDANVVEDAVRQALHRGLIAVANVLPAVQYLAGSRGGLWHVRPDAVADLNGSWLMEVASGTCAKRPATDWRVEAEEFAEAHGARLHAAGYFLTSNTMSLELVWPVTAAGTKPTSTTIRQEAKRRFGWVN